MAFDKNSVLTVQEFNAAAKRVIEGNLPLLWVRGEISNFVSAASGHWYFSLKDEQAQIRCVMFRHKSQYLDWKPTNGQQVEVLALPTLYEARGDFQLTLEKMRPAGLGALYEAFEKLKHKLGGEGLFADERKRALPYLPRQIGIITSPQAAALRDVLRTLADRMPNIPVILYPTPVQGDGAAQKIASAIRLANERAECDTLIVCRGGGSIEDLWAFNEEVVARAIASSRLPIVSGVGHETDFTIADFVADLRAATPTAAAQACVPDKVALTQRVQLIAERLSRASTRHLETRMQQLDYLQRRLVHPAQRLQQHFLQLETTHQRLQRAQRNVLAQYQWRWQHLQQRVLANRPDLTAHHSRLQQHAHCLHTLLDHQNERRRLQLASLQQQLQHLDPQQVLARGYSLVRDAQGRLVSDSRTLNIGDTLQVTFASGGVRANITDKSPQ